MDRERLAELLEKELFTLVTLSQRGRLHCLEIADKILAAEDPPKNKIEPLELIHSADGYWYAKDKNTEAIYCALMFIEKKINELIADRNKQ